MEKLSRKVKGVMVDEVAGLIKKNPYLFFVNFEKVKASKTEKLRKTLKKSSSELKVVKRSILKLALKKQKDRKSTRLNSSHSGESRMPSSA